MKNEQQRLDDISSHSMYEKGACACTTDYFYRCIVPKFIKKGNILELGPAEGVGTKYLSTMTDNLMLVDGALSFCDILKERYPEAIVYCSLFEDFRPDESFDNIILGHVLEHVENPVQILSIVQNWLKPNGLIFVAVPNKNSIHRQAAVLMGLLESEDSFSELDKHHGHRRVYGYSDLKNDFDQAGLTIVNSGGYWLKPISNAQIEKDWTSSMLDAFMKLGEKYPEIAAEIYVIAKR
ncbi:class I SAM-dependent methyltransferase [uncultured Parabacteroides sp.]|uniref:class I SAM-dependent methyltransferase n=1 Tax=uncultured Parabacteroides sp. TaxID=512312 RepID=UPI0025ECDE58|nr:class I SAM-dependent methyltransferase [uncultured Parabacteroides sp.]